MSETAAEQPAAPLSVPVPAEPTPSQPRVKSPDREQAPVQLARVDNLLPAEHLARVVWGLVGLMDLSPFYARIKAVEGQAGHPATDPKLLVALWLYATADGIGSARELDRRCREHAPYVWLCGGVPVNYHTLADFRVGHEADLDRLLTQQVTALMASGLVRLERTAQDGLRVRASAGSSSFRRRARLEEFEATAAKRVAELKAEGATDQQQRTARQRAAQERAARERLERVQQALRELKEVEAAQAKSHKKKADRKEPRSSTTDPQARIMSMPAGGFRPAVNVELSSDTNSGVIVDAAVTNQVDQGQAQPALERIQQRYGQLPPEHLVDGGFIVTALFVFCRAQGISLYAPPPKSKTAAQPAGEAAAHSEPSVAEWLARMRTEAAQAIYKLRAQTSEWVNAGMRQRDLYQVTVRGLPKVHCVALWQALTHNLLRSVTLVQRAVI